MRIKTFCKAFSITELLVVIAIFGLISTVILANHSKFNSSVLLGNVAYDVALSVRQAQVYGLSTRQYSNQFRLGYGIRFAGNSTYAFFADIDRNKKYDTGTDSIIQTYSFGQGHSLKRFCGIKSDNTQNCSDDPAPLTFLDVVFLRPEPDATITGDTGVLYSSATIEVQSSTGETRMVTVQSTGQISVVPEQNNTNTNQCSPANVCNNAGTAVINSCTSATVQTCQYGCSNGTCNACVATNICSGSNVVNSCTGAVVQSCQYGCANGACGACTPTNICSGSNVVNSCTGAVVQSCSNGCSNGSCNACVATYSCPNGFDWINSCTGGVAKACANGCSASYPSCLVSGGGGGCFSPDTLILMADGTYKPIVKVVVGDTVLAQDETGARVPNTVTKLFVHTDKETRIVNESLVVTPVHPIMTTRGWVEAGNLVVGDVMVGIHGTVEIRTIQQGEVLPKVYNLEVEPNHTYFAGGVLVHNKQQQ